MLPRLIQTSLCLSFPRVKMTIVATMLADILFIYCQHFPQQVIFKDEMVFCIETS